jgi:arylsulfatase A-like enzyme
MAGRHWTPLLPDSAYPEPDAQPREAGGQWYTFPHILPADSAEAAGALKDFPWMDEVTLDFALAGVEALDLGRGPGIDVVAVSLSATDHVGHRYGPDSRELHDQILRLDRALGVFLDSLYRLRDSTRVVVALTGDHGVAPFPELQAERSGRAAGYVSLRGPMAAVRQALQARGIPPRAFRLEGATLWVERPALEAAGLDPDSVIASFAAAVRQVPGVARADLVRELARADTARDVFARRWLHALPPSLPIEVVVTLDPYWAWGRGGGDAQHGTPHDYDAHVPLVFYGAPFQAGRYDDTVRVVDIAPTLAAALGVTPAEPVDGRVLIRALRRAAIQE